MTPENAGPSSGEPLDVDEAFAAIVADWGRQTPDEQRKWPVSEDAPPATEVDADPPRPDRDEGADDDGWGDDGWGSAPAEPARVGAGQGFGGQGFATEDDEPEPFDDEGYTPPEPPPLPRLDAVLTAAWAGALGGPLVLLIAVLGWGSATPQFVLVLAVVAFVAGFVTLVARMPQHRDDDDGDGAVV